MKSLVFFVPGIPAPQGSMRAFMPKGARFPVVTADNPKTKPWRSTIGVVTLDGLVVVPVVLACAFLPALLARRPRRNRRRTSSLWRRRRRERIDVSYALRSAQRRGE